MLGDRLVHEHPTDGPLVGRIVETEAYTGDDPACHGSSLHDTANPQGADARASGLFAAPGRGYVYLIYGMHWLLNVVTEPEGTCGAVLIRAVEPLAGEEALRRRRGPKRRDVDLTNGPGKLAEAFDVDKTFHQADLTQPPLYVAPGPVAADETVATSSRIGISNGVEREWRFYLKENPYVSRATPSAEKQ